MRTLSLAFFLAACAPDDAAPDDAAPDDAAPDVFTAGPPPVGGCGPGVVVQVGTTPYPDVATAVSVAQPGDTVWICPGVHRTNVASANLDNVTISGWTGNPADVVLMSTMRARSILSLQGAGRLWVSGLTLRGGVGAVMLSATTDQLVLYDVVVEDGVDAPAIDARAGKFSFRDVIARDNTTGTEPVVRLFYPQTILPSRFVNLDVSGNTGGPALVLASALIPNQPVRDAVFVNANLSDNTSAVAGGALQVDMDRVRMWFDGGTIVGNQAQTASAIDWLPCDNSQSFLYMRNTLIAGNTDDAGMPLRIDGSHCTMRVGLVGVQLLRNGSTPGGASDSVLHLTAASARLTNVDFGAGADANTVPDLVGCAVDYGAGASGVVNTTAGDFCL
jgi:hypothetical protein